MTNLVVHSLVRWRKYKICVITKYRLCALLFYAWALIPQVHGQIIHSFKAVHRSKLFEYDADDLSLTLNLLFHHFLPLENISKGSR